MSKQSINTAAVAQAFLLITTHSLLTGSYKGTDSLQSQYRERSACNETMHMVRA